MPNFVIFTFADTFDICHSLHTRLGLFKPGEREGIRVLPIRGFRKDTEPTDESFVGYPVATKWVELNNMRSRLKRVGDQLLGTVEFGRIYFEMLDAGAKLPWSEGEAGPYAERWGMMHLPLRTNPGAVMYAGTEISSPGQGWATIVNHRAPHSAINLGEHSRIHLVVEFRKRETDDGQ